MKALFQGVDQRQWWVALVVFGSGFLAAAIAVKERDLVLIALGIVAFGFGEWRNHPLQTGVGPGFKTTSYPHRASAFGMLLDALGAALIGLGLYRFLAA